MNNLRRAEPQRSDSLRNRQRLIDVVGEQLQTGNDNMTMTAVARLAGLSVPTAYRYFADVDAIKNAYLFTAVEELRKFSDACDATGIDLFRAVMTEWFRIQLEQGPAIVRVRSRSGFLERLHGNDMIIAEVKHAWQRPIRELLRGHGLQDVDADIALYFHNLLFDPREIIDLRNDTGMTDDSLRETLTRVYLSAIRSWNATK